MKNSTRFLMFCFAAVAVVGQTTESLADAKRECIATNESAQSQRDEHYLIQARDLFRQCANDRCPKVIRKDCADAVSDLDRRIPSVVCRVKSTSGSDVVTAKAFLDGQAVAELSDGRELTLDPGVHEFRFESSGYLPKSVKLVVSEGEQRRTIDVVLDTDSPLPARSASVAPPPPALLPNSSTAKSSSPIPYVLAGLGVVAIGVGAGFYYAGMHKRSDHISAGCSTQSQCDSEKSSIRSKLLVGDVLTGVGLVSVVTGVVWAFRGQKESEISGAAAPPAQSAVFDLRAISGGAMSSASFVF
jgi:hypothetical protein